MAAAAHGYCTIGCPIVPKLAAVINGFRADAAFEAAIAAAAAAAAEDEFEAVLAAAEVGVDEAAEAADFGFGDLGNEDIGGACSCWTRLLFPPADEGAFRPLKRSKTVLRLFLLTVCIPWGGGGGGAGGGGVAEVADLFSCTGRIFAGKGPGLGLILLSDDGDGPPAGEDVAEEGGLVPEAGKVF